jgi:hypothetical protein
MERTSRPIQELLRHATFKVTADTYTQAVTPVKRDAQARIAKLILADVPAAKPSHRHSNDHLDPNGP